MKYLILLFILLFYGFAVAVDSADDDEGCGGKPRPELPLGCNNEDISCSCSAGACDWVVNCN